MKYSAIITNSSILPTCVATPNTNYEFIYWIPPEEYFSFFEFCEVEDLKLMKRN